jgi:GT2 family glycosyltransferase
LRLFTWLRNTLRNRLRSTLAWRLLRSAGPRRVHIVSATRMDERTFWKTSALGRSLSTWRGDPRLGPIEVAFENRLGLPAVYNAALDRAAPDDAVLFIHDDIWLDDPEWLPKLLVALRRFDVVGVAGNVRRVRDQVAWLFLKAGDDGRFWLDGGHLSGAVAHGPRPGGEVTYFGPSPAHCELLDGLFIAARKDVAARSGVRFDELFDFHFYDLDFCRTARQAGLSVGTWPIAMTHQSKGAFNSPGWRSGLERYRSKWKH